MPEKLTPAEKMLKGKKRLIARLRQEIKNINKYRDEEISNVESRIRIAQSLVDALEKGTLKP